MMYLGHARDFLILLVLWILGGAIVFGVYYLLYKRAIKKNIPITSNSLIIKVPLIIGCSNALLGVGLFILFGVLSQWYDTLSTLILSQGHSTLTPATQSAIELSQQYYTPTPSIIFFTILRRYIFLAIPIFIGSIAISILNYKKQLISKKRLGIVVLMNIISIISYPMLLLMCFFIVVNAALMHL